MRVILFPLVFSFAVSVNLSCEKNEEQKPNIETSQPDAPAKEDFRHTLIQGRFESLVPEGKCEKTRMTAFQNRCISERGLKALEVLKAIPVCTNSQEFSHWEPCEHKALQEIRAILTGVERCTVDTTNSDCQFESIEFHARPANEISRGQRIMVIDDNLGELGAWRYKSRVLDVLVADKSGSYYSASVATKIPKPMKSIIELLDKKYQWLSPKSLVGIENEYRRVLSDHDLVYPSTHGFRMVNHLAEFNPKAEFVLAEFNRTNVENVCAVPKDKNALERIRNFTRNEARSLIAKIKEYDVNFVNMSFGRVAHQWIFAKDRPCGAFFDRENLFEIDKIYLEEFFKPLSELPGVIVVQATPRSSNEIPSLDEIWPTCAPPKTLFHMCEMGGEHFDYEKVINKDKTYLTDCVHLPGRLRVGKTSVVRPYISIFGSNDLSLVDDVGFRNSASCTDVYLNEGSRPGKTPSKEDWSFSLWHSMNGIETEPVFTTGSSNVAPLAISFMIQLKRMDPSLTPKQLIEKVKSGGKIKDPLQHELHLFNVFGSDDFQEVIEKQKIQQ